MADIPPIHVCHALSSQNEILTEKYDKLKKSYKKLHAEMLELKEDLMRVRMEKEYCSRDAGMPQNVSVENIGSLKDGTSGKVKVETTEKLLQLNNQLLKQFEKGNKQLKNSEKKIVKYEQEKEKLQNDLFEANKQVSHLKKQLADKEDKFQALNGKLKILGRSKKDFSGQLNDMKKEKEQLANENTKLKGELKGIDESFFDEIEDMKYALQQSAKLNTEYERALRRLCKQYGMNYNTLLFPSQKEEQKHKRGRTR